MVKIEDEFYEWKTTPECNEDRTVPSMVKMESEWRWWIDLCETWNWLHCIIISITLRCLTITSLVQSLAIWFVYSWQQNTTAKRQTKDSCSLAYAGHFSSCRQAKFSTCHLFVRLLCVESVIAQEGPTTKTFYLSLWSKYYSYIYMLKSLLNLIVATC